MVVSAFLAISVAVVGTSGAERAASVSIPDSAYRPVELLDGASAIPAVIGPVATSDLAVIRDLWVAPPPPARAKPTLPASKPVTVVAPKPPTHHISGAASYYCRAGSSPCTTGYPDGSAFNAYAAAGPRLRAALGSNWRGKVILVDGIRVKLIDWCQCYKGEPNEKLLDLYYDVFARTGSSVTIRW